MLDKILNNNEKECETSLNKNNHNEKLKKHLFETFNHHEKFNL